MSTKIFLLLISLSIALNIFGQIPRPVKIIIENCKYDSLIISEQLGKEVKDKLTLITSAGNSYTLYTKNLKPGIYFIGTKSVKDKEMIIISEKDNFSSLYLDSNLKYSLTKNKSSENNAYHQFKEKTKKLVEQIKNFNVNGDLMHRDSSRYELNKARIVFLAEHKNTIAAKLIRSEKDWIDPPYSIYNRKEHNELITSMRIDSFLQNVDLQDSISLRLPSVYTLIMDYFDKAVHIRPELVIPKLDSIFSQMGYNSPMTKYYLPIFENKYSFAFRPWVDTVYIHLAKKYYNKEICNWLEDSEIQRVKDECRKKEGSLIGKIIPDVVFQDEKGNDIRLLDIKAKFIVLDFWRPECSHCTEAFHHLKAAWEQFNIHDVVFVAVCTRQQSDAKMCWDKSYGEKPAFFKYSLADVKGTTGFLNKFNVGGVPNIMILDENKKILDKKINPPSVINLLAEYLKQDN